MFLITVILVIAVVWAIVRLGMLETRLRELEQAHWRLENRVDARPRAAEPQPQPQPQPAPQPQPQPPPQSQPQPRPAAALAPPQPIFATSTAAVAAAPRAGGGIEANLTTKLPVWIGSIALFLAGVYLVKYTVDHAVLGPTARVALGLALGVVLLVAGELLRGRSARVAEGLSAAGVADLYAALLAGISLYQLIPTSLGFVLIALVTATAVLLSLRHGMLIAVLGLVGGFISPALIGAKEPHVGALFTYLFLLHAGLVLVARPRRWPAIAALASIGSALWAFTWLVLFFRPGDEVAIGLFLLGSAIAFLAVGRTRPDAWGPAIVTRTLEGLAIVAAVVLLAVTVHAGAYGPLAWSFLGVLAAGLLVLGRLDERFEPFPWFAALAGLALLAVWPSARPADDAFARTALFYGGLLALGAYAASWRAAHPERWAALSSVTAIGYFLVTWATLRGQWDDLTWGVVCVALAALFTAGALPLVRRRAEGGLEPAIAAVVATATLFVSGAVPFALDRSALTVTWALEVAALAWLEGRLGVKPLRVVAGLLGAIVLARLLLNPSLAAYPVGTWPVVNWMLWLYGVPVVAFACAAWLWRRQGTHDAAAVAEGAAIVLGAVLGALEVRHVYHAAFGAPGLTMRQALSGGSPGPCEWATLVLLWLAMGAGLVERNRVTPRLPLAWGGRALEGLALGASAIGLLLFGNPLLERFAVGETPVLNRLLIAYGLPALAFLGVSWRERGRPDGRPYRVALGVGTLAMVFALVTLEIRQAFQGSVMNEGAAGSAEMYAYSAAWLVFGLALLALAIATKGGLVRWASAAVIGIAVCKVFLVDLSALRDLWRVCSLLALGACLFLLAFLYQKYVFRGAER